MLRNKGNENENKNGRTAKHIDEITLENQGLEKLLKQDKSEEGIETQSFLNKPRPLKTDGILICTTAFHGIVTKHFFQTSSW